MKKTFKGLVILILSGLVTLMPYANFVSICQQSSCCCGPDSKTNADIGLAKSCCGCKMTEAVPVPIQPIIIANTLQEDIQKQTYGVFETSEPLADNIAFDLEISIYSHSLSPPQNKLFSITPLRC